MKRKVFFSTLLISDCASWDWRVRAGGALKVKTDFLFARGLGRRCCFSSQLNAIKMFNFSSFLLASIDCGFCLRSLTCERAMWWRVTTDDERDEREIQIFRRAGPRPAYHQHPVMVRNNISRNFDIFTLLDARFRFNSRRNASTSMSC